MLEDKWSVVGADNKGTDIRTEDKWPEVGAEDKYCRQRLRQTASSQLQWHRTGRLHEQSTGSQRSRKRISNLRSE